MTELAPRQREMLVFIARCIKANGYQPSYREIAKHFGWQSPAYCTSIVQRLGKLGIARNRGSRALSFDWQSYLTEPKRGTTTTTRKK